MFLTFAMLLTSRGCFDDSIWQKKPTRMNFIIKSVFEGETVTLWCTTFLRDTNSTPAISQEALLRKRRSRSSFDMQLI